MMTFARRWIRSGRKKVGILLGIPSKRLLLVPRIKHCKLLIIKYIMELAEGLEPPTL
jgi:hypothetical protein